MQSKIFTISADSNSRIIEINPFAHFAEAMYFSWTLDSDLRVLVGDVAFQLRMLAADDSVVVTQ